MRDNEAQMTLKQFFRMEFTTVLDSLCCGLQDNLNTIKSTVLPLHKIFSFPLNKDVLTIETVKNAVKMYPLSARPDPYCLQAELEVLFKFCHDKAVTSMQQIIHIMGDFKDSLKIVFTLCQLITTAGYGVSSNERSFSRLKFVKNFLRSTMLEERLDSLMILNCEVDLTDSMDIDKLIDNWCVLKKRRIIIK